MWWWPGEVVSPRDALESFVRATEAGNKIILECLNSMFGGIVMMHVGGN
jgi:hypothetical protein